METDGRAWHSETVRSDQHKNPLTMLCVTPFPLYKTKPSASPPSIHPLATFLPSSQLLSLFFYSLSSLMGSLGANLPFPSIHGFKPLDLDDLKEQVHQIVDFIMDYYKNVESFPVLPSVQPGYLRRLLPATPPTEPTTFDAILRDLHRAIVPGLTHWASPNFFAYFPATLSSAALAGDLLASALNPVAFTWHSSPAATELESLVLDWLAQVLRFPSCFLSSSASASSRGGGVLHTTTSEAMLCTLVAARDAALRRYGGFAAAISRLVTYGSDQTHSTFFKACRIAGFNPAHVRSIPTRSESDFSLDPARLRAAMAADAAAGLIPTYVCATVGTTSSTAVDPVGPISEVAAEFGAWVHVDAAYAGNACVCPEFRQYLDGVERADSISLSPHKWLLTCLDCTCLWVRDTRLLSGPLGTNPEYLKNGPSESGSVVDLKDLQVGVGRRFRALKLWMVIQSYGVANLQAHIRSDVEMAQGFEGMVRSDRRFEMVVPRRFALVCFRLRPRGGMGEGRADEENRRLLEMINGSGRAYITHTVVGGKYVLRFAVGSTLTEERHVADAWELIRKKADEIQGVEVEDNPVSSL